MTEPPWSAPSAPTSRPPRDPALMESADRGEVELLAYGELYRLWERQQWAVQDIDFTQDRIDWHERIPPEERYQRMYGLSSFFIGEQRVAAELGPMMRAAPDEDMRIFLCTQIADEARHVQFFDRFYSEVGVLESDNLQDRLAETSAHLNPNFKTLFDEMLQGPGRPAAARARGPRDAGRGDHALPHGHRGDAGPHRPALHHRVQRVEQGTLPGFVEGFNNVARDEHRHVAFGARFLREMAEQDSATARRSSARWWSAGRPPTACCSRRGTTRARTTRSSASRWTRRARSR